jgi:hypothetical protein
MAFTNTGSNWFQPLSAYPDFSGQTFGQPGAKTDWSKIYGGTLPFPVVGTDLSSGKRDQVVAMAQQERPSQAPLLPTGYDPVGSLDPLLKSISQFNEYNDPRQLRLAQAANQQAAQLSLEQMYGTYPILEQAAESAQRRNLRGSFQWDINSPTRQMARNAVAQDIAASRQGQAYTAAQGEAARANAVANQAQAAAYMMGQGGSLRRI